MQEKICEICEKTYLGNINKKVCSNKCLLIKKKKFNDQYYINHREELIKKELNKYWKNPEPRKKSALNLYYKKRDIILAQHKEPKRKKYISEYMSIYQKENSNICYAANRRHIKKRINEWPAYRVIAMIRSNLSKKLNNYTEIKGSHYQKYIGCTLQELRTYIEKQFQSGMSWKNRGLKTWHIDHIRPVCSFDLTDVNSVYECYHYTNLQPLWYQQNKEKGKKYDKF